MPIADVVVSCRSPPAAAMTLDDSDSDKVLFVSRRLRKCDNAFCLSNYSESDDSPVISHSIDRKRTFERYMDPLP